MGLKYKRMKSKNIVFVVSILVGFPLLFWALGDFPRRTILKEIISVITIISFSMLIGQFFLTRGNIKLLKLPPMGRLIKFHRIFGYIFIGILLIHPFLIVFPRYFESGVEPIEAFTTLLTTFNSTGVILGIVAWVLMLIIGITSVFRYRLPLSYLNWRLLHGILSLIFIIVASWHAIDLGRHTDIPMSVTIIILSGTGIVLLLKTYLIKPHNKIG